jgi:hypothetical protein
MVGHYLLVLLIFTTNLAMAVFHRLIRLVHTNQSLSTIKNLELIINPLNNPCCYENPTNFSGLK